MARNGIYFSDVKKARDQLLAQGRHPSIDAVRAALGDTGSKTTIHKYLKEMESESDTQHAPVSDSILALITQLAERLNVEAGVQVEAIRTEMATLRKQHDAAIAQVENRLASAIAQTEGLHAELAATTSALASCKTALQNEQIARHTAEQHAADLDIRVADAERHQASLEDKHRNARDALEHYRTASREQREQESRRHEQQLHSAQTDLRQAQLAAAAKAEELTRVNRETAALASELGANKQVLYLEKETGRKLARKVEQLQATEARVAVLEAQLAATDKRAEQAELAAARADEQCGQLREEKMRLEIALTIARDNSALEQRLAKLDNAVFGTRDEGTNDAPASQVESLP